MKFKKWLCLILALLLAAALLPQPEAQAVAPQAAFLTFSDSGIQATEPGAGYVISGTTLTVTAAGTYRITGQCSEGSVVVSKGLSNVTLILQDLDLTASATAPVVIKKGSSVLMKLEGESTLTDSEDPSTEATNADFEGACVKVKSGSSLTVSGDGSLHAVGSAKNGIKGAAESALTVDGGKLTVQAANNAVAFDGSVTVNGGTLELTADGDGLKSEPDETDTVSAGTVIVHSGELKIRAQGDGIHAKTALTITGGSFGIQTLDGYQSRNFDADTMSCKGLKASDGATEDSASSITVSGGTFVLDTADDAIHSDGDVTITAGTFTIYTGDDGAHADAALTLGTQDGYERDPEMTILSSYEGLEGGTINGYSGKYYIVASDDGINAAGGSSNGSDPFGPGGGWRPGGPGGPGGSASGDYSINFYGGAWYVDCQGDGLDSNGALNMYGGDFTVLSMRANGDNSPLDADGGILIRGATVFGAGSAGMSERPSSSSQKYYTDSTRRSAGTVVNISDGGSVVYSETLLRDISYLFYSSPTLSAASVSTASSVSTHQSNAWAHDWDEGTVQIPATAEAPGLIVYTCSCGAQERKTIDPLWTSEPHTQEPGEETCEHDYQAVVTEPTCVDAGYTTYTCSKCGDSYVSDEVPALGHDFGEWKTTKEATCTEQGEESRNCSRCSVRESRKTAALGHDYKAAVTAPTCTEAGFTTYTCTRCGDSYQADEVDALGHDYKDGVCTRCGETDPNYVPPVDKSELDAAIANAEKLSQADYTPESYKALTDAVDAAKALADDADQAAVDAAAKAINDAIDALESAPDKADKRELAKAIAAAEAIDPEKYASVEDLNKALEAAKAVNDKDDATQDEVDAAAKALDDAIKALKEKVNKEALAKAIEDAKAMDPDEYTEESVKALDDAVKAAEEVNAKEDATQEEVDAAVKAVNDAIAGLEKKPDDKFLFDDVKDESKFFFDPVYWAYYAEPQITNGKTSTTFGPDDPCTRGHVVTFLWRAAGCPEPEKAQTPFTDLKPGAFYEKAVAWAVEKGITKGTTDTTFAPDATCTRGQIVTFLYRFKESPEVEEAENPFTDLKPDAFYEKAVAWAVASKVTNGMTATTFVPDGTCLRGQVVTFLYRAMDADKE